MVTLHCIDLLFGVLRFQVSAGRVYDFFSDTRKLKAKALPFG
jgi:hypothetical protein